MNDDRLHEAALCRAYDHGYDGVKDSPFAKPGTPRCYVEALKAGCHDRRMEEHGRRLDCDLY